MVQKEQQDKPFRVRITARLSEDCDWIVFTLEIVGELACEVGRVKRVVFPSGNSPEYKEFLKVFGNAVFDSLKRAGAMMGKDIEMGPAELTKPDYTGEGG